MDVAVLGYGTIGSGVVEVLKVNQDVIEKMKVIKRFYTEHQDEYRKEVG